MAVSAMILVSKVIPVRLMTCSLNEHLRLSERFLKFDVLALQNIVSSASGHSISELQSFSKLSEGGYNRVFEATFGDEKCSRETTLSKYSARALYSSERSSDYEIPSPTWISHNRGICLVLNEG